MNPKIILTDLDGPLADFEGEFLRRWRDKYPDEFFIPFEERRSFFFNDEYPEHLRKQAADVLEEPGFFAALAPVTSGLEAVKSMVELGHKVVICTSDIYMNKSGLADKRAWVEKHLGVPLAKGMIFTRDKTLVRGDYLIDDKPEITGALQPAWKHVVFDQPFNRNTSHELRISMDWSNWEDVII